MKRKVSKILFIAILGVILGIGGFFAGLSISDAVMISGSEKIVELEQDVTDVIQIAHPKRRQGKTRNIPLAHPKSRQGKTRNIPLAHPKRR